MSLQIDVLCSGPLENNVVLLHDDLSHRAVVIDPSFEPQEVLNLISIKGLTVDSILFTHGHFDHFAGLSYLLANLVPQPRVGLHEADLGMWRAGGGSVQFRMQIDFPPDPDFHLAEGHDLELYNFKIQVRHTPGHSPGSVIFYIESINTAVVGDLIFKQGVGRTDLDGGSFATLKHSIETSIFTLPPETILIPGHGPATTVASEMKLNPYVGLTSQFL